LYSVFENGNESSAPALFEFKFLRVDAVPRASKTVSSMLEDSPGAKIVLNGSDSDSKYVAFVITELPRMGKLRMASGEPIETPFSAFEVRVNHRCTPRVLSAAALLIVYAATRSDAGACARAADVRRNGEECKLVLASGPESEEAAVPLQHASQLERRAAWMRVPAVASISDPRTAEYS
jgi:hypothetical protein